MGKLSELFQIERGVTSIIGGGGKTSLMYALAEELSQYARVIVTTTTKIMEPESYRVIYQASYDVVAKAFAGNMPVVSELESSNSNIIVLGEPSDNGKLVQSVMDISAMCKLADYVLVEADGAKHLPLKAHADYEPVLVYSDGSKLSSKAENVIYVVGADAFNKKIADVCHRPKLYCDKLNDYYACGQMVFTPETRVSALVASDFIACEGYGDIFFVNKVENEEQLENAKKFATELRKQIKKECPVLAGSLKDRNFEML